MLAEKGLPTPHEATTMDPTFARLYAPIVQTLRNADLSHLPFLPVPVLVDRNQGTVKPAVQGPQTERLHGYKLDLPNIRMLQKLL